MRYVFLILACIAVLWCFGQEANTIDLSEFQLENNTSPAFVLIGEAPSEIYVPENLKALTIHALSNLGGSLSVEVSPYYFINTKSEDRTYFRFIGVEKDGEQYKQKPFSGLNTTTLSFGYANKEFENVAEGERKTFSIGIRTRLLRFYNKEEVIRYYDEVSAILAGVDYPVEVLLRLQQTEDEEEKAGMIREFWDLEKLKKYSKPVKPVFRVDGALGYGTLFKENRIDSGTLNRFGAWLTSAFSLILNKGAARSTTNNYFNVLVIARYVEDGYTLATDKLYYRDIGGKAALEFGNFSFGYEYIKRNGTVSSERSVGNISYAINKDITLTGGFGKDFAGTDNLFTVFGINWGINMGKSTF